MIGFGSSAAIKDFSGPLLARVSGEGAARSANCLRNVRTGLGGDQPQNEKAFGEAEGLVPSVSFAVELAQANCAQCHAIGPIRESPLRIAPPFRTLHERYPVDTLAEALAEGIVTGRPSMPEFRLDVAQINDLIAYLQSLERIR